MGANRWDGPADPNANEAWRWTTFARRPSPAHAADDSH